MGLGKDLAKQAVTTGVIVGAAGLAVYLLFKNKGAVVDSIFGANTTASTKAFWGNLFGVAPAGTAALGPVSVPETAAEHAGTEKLRADAGPHTLWAYDNALSMFAYNHGFKNGATAEASDAWPYYSFDDWKEQGFPDLAEVR